MIIAITDACFLIDLIDINLFDEFLGLGYQIHITSSVFAELEGLMPMDELFKIIWKLGGEEISSLPVHKTAKVYFEYIQDKKALSSRIRQLNNSDDQSPESYKLFHLLRSIHGSFSFCSRHFELAELAVQLS